MEKREKKNICVHVTKEDYERLAYLAKETSRTTPGYLRWLLHEHFKNLDKQEGKQDGC